MVDAIKGTSRDGDFVHASQTMGLGFRNVSKLWLDKTMTFEQGRGVIATDLDNREDIMCTPGQMVPTFDEDEGVCYFEYEDGRKFLPTPHALRQYGTRTHIPHTFLNAMSTPILKQNGEVRYERDKGDQHALWTVLKNGHRRMKDEIHRWRTNTDGTVRACLTEMYAPVDNRWFLDRLEAMVPGGRLSHFDYSDADTIRGNVLIPDTLRQEEDSDYGGMSSFTNCEIGILALDFLPSVFRAICMNGCIWGQTKGFGLRVVHRRKAGIDLGKLSSDLSDNLQSQIPLMANGIEMLLDTRSWDIHAEDVAARQVIAKVAIESKLTGPQSMTLFSNWNKFGKAHQSAFGVIDAMTRTGQEFSGSVWNGLDRAAGKLVTDGQVGWTQLLKRSASVDDKAIEKLMKRGQQLAA
jgi:hypothetical protein